MNTPKAVHLSDENKKVDLDHVWTDILGLDELDPIEKSIEITNFYRSSEWDLIGVPGKKTNIYYPCCVEPFPDITFNISIRRKPLFYTYNLMMPCISINMLTCIAFYLPSDSSEKISLCVTVLLSLSMFLLLLMDMIPATSIKVPLMGKYILFTMATVSLSVMVSVVTLNTHFRSSATHRMPRFMRRLFLDFLPKFLLMNRPALLRRWNEEFEADDDDDEMDTETYWAGQNDTNAYQRLKKRSNGESGGSTLRDATPVDPFNLHPYGTYGINPDSRQMIYDNASAIRTTFLGGDNLLMQAQSANFCRACARMRQAASTKYPIQVHMALEGLMFLKDHHKGQDESKMVDLRHVWTESLELGETDPIERGLDVDDYYRSTEWDLVGIPAKKNVKYYPCCIEPYPDITFNISIRRKTLFYTINLLVPCISINLLTILTFYLPSDSGEKISLCITLLLSLSMFQLLLMELIPATSMKVPLLGKFILFTTVIVSLSVVVTVVTLNMNFRSNSTTVMPKRTRKLFLDILPRLLFMKSPLVESLREEREAAKKGVKEEETYWSEWEDPQNDRTNFGIDPRNDPGCRSPLDADPENAFTSDMYARPQENMYNQDPFNMHPNRGIRQPQYGNRYNDNNEYNVVGTTFLGGNELWRDNDVSVECPACSAKKSATSKFPLHIRKALEGIEFVEKHHKDDDDSKVVRDEWKFVALVIDRFLLWIYISMCCIGSASILLNAPMLYVNKEVL